MDWSIAVEFVVNPLMFIKDPFIGLNKQQITFAARQSMRGICSCQICLKKEARVVEECRFTISRPLTEQRTKAFLAPSFSPIAPYNQLFNIISGREMVEHCAHLEYNVHWEAWRKSVELTVLLICGRCVPTLRKNVGLVSITLYSVVCLFNLRKM